MKSDRMGRKACESAADSAARGLEHGGDAALGPLER